MYSLSIKNLSSRSDNYTYMQRMLRRQTYAHTCTQHTHSMNTRNIRNCCFLFVYSTHTERRQIVVSFQHMQHTVGSAIQQRCCALTFDSRSLYMTHWWCVIYWNCIHTVRFKVQNIPKIKYVRILWMIFTGIF